MNKTIYSLLLILFSFFQSYSQFVPTTGPGNSTVKHLAVSGQYLFAGTQSAGVYLTTNNGNTWVQSNSGLGSLEIYKLVASGQNIFAGTAGGFYRSTNYGMNWSQSDYGSPNGVTALRYFDGALYIGSNTGSIYKSTNNGANWYVYASNVTGTINDIYIYNGIILAAATGVHSSTNGGANWVVENIGSYLTILKVFFQTGNTIRLGTSSGGMKNTTPTGGWIEDIPWSNYVLGYSWVGSYLIAGMSTGMFWSSDNGTTWHDPNLFFMMGSYVNCIVENNDYVFAGTGLTVYRRPVSELNALINIGSGVPVEFSLKQNYPNPFNPSTNIKFDVPKFSNVSLIVYNQLGEVSAELINQKLVAGTYEYNFNTTGLPSGVYFYRLIAEGNSYTRKMILIK